jgi:hypothetical protein
LLLAADIYLSFTRNCFRWVRCCKAGTSNHTSSTRRCQ